MEFKLEEPLIIDSTTDPSSLFLIESEHMPSEEYIASLLHGDFNVTVRRQIIASVSQFGARLNPVVSYLSINYLDRYLSSQRLAVTKQWALSLVAISCVTLAAKMLGLNVSLSDLQMNSGLILETDTVYRMEVVILGALKWRMRSITPFSFVPFFISMFKVEDPLMRLALKSRATEIIFASQADIGLLGVKPSIVAAASVLFASKELFPLQFTCVHDSVIDGSYVNKDQMDQCFDRMQRVAAEGYGSIHKTDDRSDTPSNVLDQPFGSTSESERVLRRQRTSGMDHSSTTRLLASVDLTIPDRTMKRD